MFDLSTVEYANHLIEHNDQLSATKGDNASNKICFICSSDFLVY